MKKILSIFLVVLLSISLFTGCNGDKPQIDSGSSENINVTNITNNEAVEANKQSSKETSESTQQGNDQTSEEDKQEKEEDEVIAEFTSLSEDSINAENAMQIIEELALEKYTGRLAGTEGNKLAVDYIANYFKEIGLESPDGLEGYLQYFSHRVRLNNSTPTLELVDKDGKVISEYRYLKDFKTYTFIKQCKLKGDIEGQIYEAKENSEINRKNKELKGKILLVDYSFIDNYRGDFYSDVSQSEIEIKGVIIGKKAHANAYANSYSFKESTVLQIRWGQARDNKPVFTLCNTETYNEILGKAKKGVKVKIHVDFSQEEVEPANVIGVIPGTDEVLKDEYIIICGHMDHVGDNKNGTYNAGALDNASGTATVMEIARVLAESKIKPKKTIVFIAFNGEEEGLKGSVYYVDKPIYPLKRTTVINLDMVGSKTILPLTIGDTIGKGIELNNTLYKYAKALGIECESKAFDSSDHVPFNVKGVEAVILINEDYNPIHTPGDTIETVDKDRLKEVMKLILFYLDKNAY